MNFVEAEDRKTHKARPRLSKHIVSTYMCRDVAEIGLYVADEEQPNKIPVKRYDVLK